MRLALLVPMLPLAGCATGAFYDCDGKPKVRPCMAGALLCSPPKG